MKQEVKSKSYKVVWNQNRPQRSTKWPRRTSTLVGLFCCVRPLILSVSIANSLSVKRAL